MSKKFFLSSNIQAKYWVEVEKIASWLAGEGVGGGGPNSDEGTDTVVL